MLHRTLVNSIGGIGLIAALMVAKPSMATVVYDGGGPDQGGQLYAQAPASEAMSFSLAVGANTINAAQWWGGCFPATTCGASPDFQLTIYSNSGGLPGAALATFDVGTANQTATGAQIGGPGGWDEYVYSASFAALTLTAGTEYWFGISENGTEPLGGNFGVETTSSAPAGQASANFNLITPNTWVANPQELAFNLSNTPTAVPEPASLALLGTALVGLGVIRRRRNRRNDGAAV